MGTISSIFAGLANGSYQANTGKTTQTPGKVTGNSTGVYGSAFEIAVSKQINADGSENDVLNYSSYEGDLGGFSTVSAQGSGSDFKSAFESLMDNLSTGSGTDAAVSAKANGLSDAFDTLESTLGDKSSTASTAKGGLLSEVGAPFNSDGGLADIEKLIDKVITSLRDELNATGMADSRSTNNIVKAYEPHTA